MQDNPICSASSRNQVKTIQKNQELKDPIVLLREKGGGREGAGTAEPARAELDLASAEVEVRRALEPTITLVRIFVSGTVDPEVVVVFEAFRVSEEQAGDGERTKTDFANVHDLTGATDGTSTVFDTELAGDRENVIAFLIFAEFVEGLDTLGVPTQVVRTEISLAVVMELAVAVPFDEV